MPTSDIFTGLNDTDILAMQQDTQSRLNNLFQNQPQQFVNPNDITQPHAPIGLYGTVSSGQNINLDKNSYEYNAADYNQQMKKISQQYPDSFKQLPDIILPQSETKRYTGQDFGFDIARDNEDFYNKHQNAAWEFFGKSIFARLPLLTFTKLGTGVGYLLGLANPVNWFEKNTISAAGDNMFAKFFEGMEDKVKNTWLPVYQSAAARDMGFFERAFKDQTFWSGDITDGAAFMASAFIPGAVASKLGLGAKIASGLAIGDALGASGEYLASTAGKFAKGFDIGLTTAINTASESMFEAKQVRDDIYNQLMATGKYTDKEAQNIAGERARNSFMSNLAALSLSNLWESNLIFKALGKGGEETAAKIGASSLLEDYTIPKTSKLGFYGKKALTGIGVEGFYEENIQQAIQQYNELGKNKGDNPLSYVGGVISQMWHQTLNALQGKDKDTAMNIGVGALIGGLFGTSMEAIRKAYTNEHNHSKGILDALNSAKDNWLKIQDVYSVDEDGKLKTDYEKAAAVLLTQSANTDKLKTIESIKDPITRNILQKQLFSSLVGSHLNNGTFDKLMNQLDDMKNWKAEDLVKLGFEPGDREQVNSQIDEYKRYADNIKEYKKIADKLKTSGVGPIDQFRKNEIFSLGYNLEALRDENTKLQSRKNVIQSKIGLSNITDDIVHAANVAKLQIESQKANVENSTDLNKKHAEQRLKELQNEYDQFLDNNKDELKDLKKDKDGYFYYKKQEKNSHPLIGQLHDIVIKEAQLRNAISDTSDEFNRHLSNESYSKNKYQEQPQNFAEFLKEVEKKEEQIQKEETQNQPKQAENKEPELTETQKIAKSLLDKRNEDLKNAKTQEERQSIGQKYLDDVKALYQGAEVQPKSPEEQEKRFDELDNTIGNSKTISIDEFNKLFKLITDEVKLGNIDGLHEAQLVDKLQSKEITGTIFDSSKDIEDENSDRDDEVDEEEERQRNKAPQEDEIAEENIEDSIERPTEDDPEIGNVDRSFNPDTNDIEDQTLEGEVFSFIAFRSSNKTVTQEEKTDDNGQYNRQLDEDPYKQFKQGYFRHITNEGFPDQGIFGKLIKDNDSLPHSQETQDYLATSNSYGSVLVLTDMDRNILYFDKFYNSSTDPKEGSQPLVYSFNNIAWKDNEAIRAIIGENRTGISYDDFLKMYEREQQQQSLARQLNQNGKEVYVDIKAVSPGVNNKSKTPLKTNDVINSNLNSTLFIPPSPVERFDPNNPSKNKYVLVGNKALINGGLYAQIIDHSTGFTSYSRLLPNYISDIPEILEDITALINNEYKDENEAEVAKEYLKDILFLGTPKRPNIVLIRLENNNYVIRIVQDNLTLNAEVSQTFIEGQRLNITRTNIESDSFIRLTINNGRLTYQPEVSYKSFVYKNSTTRDLPIATFEGHKFLALNSYAMFDFLDSMETMQRNLEDKEAPSPTERIVKLDKNEVPTFTGKYNEDEAKTLGEKLKKIGIDEIITSTENWIIARTIGTSMGLDSSRNMSSSNNLSDWNIGDFKTAPASLFDETYFATNPDVTEKGARVLRESFNTFVNRVLKAYKEYSINRVKKPAIIANSRILRVWEAYKQNGEQWNEKAVERYLNLPSDINFTSLVKKEIEQDSSSLTKSPLRKLGTIDVNESEAQRLAREQDEKDKGLKAITDTRENRGLIRQSEIDKVNQIFGSEVVIRINNIINSDARAIWNISGIKLYRNARGGDGYHEAWHHFSQMYLTIKEKRSLYDEARKKDINFKDRDGNKLNSKTASDFQLEEFIADDFRDYVESDGKSRLVERPHRNNIFRKILDFLKKFFFGDINIAKLYDDLYKGNLNHYTPSINNAMWGKLNSKALNQRGEEIVNNQKAAYYRGVVDFFMGDQLIKANTSVDQLRKNRKLAEAIYKNIYNDIVTKYYNPMLEKADRGEDINQEVAEDLFNILTNWEDFVQYHKEASKLFVNIPHDLAIDVPENPEDLTDKTDAAENSEVSEFDAEMNDEAPEEYEAAFSDKLYDKVGNEQSSLEAASIETKGLIRMLPEITYKDGNFTIAIDLNGFPKLCDYAKTWNNLALELSNISSYTEMMTKLHDPEVMRKIPEISVLIKHLPDPLKEHTPAEINTLVAFRTDFNRAYIGIYSGKIAPQQDGTIKYYFNEETKRNRDQVSKLWTNNFVGKLNTDPDITSENVLVDPETGKYYLNPSRALTYNMATVNGREQFLKLIGFSFSDESKRQSWYKNELSQFLKNIQDNINQRHEYGQRIFNPLFDLRSDLIDPSDKGLLAPGLRQVFDGLLFFEAKYSTEVPSLSYQTSEGEMIYGLSLNHTLSIVSNRLNRARSYNDIIDDPALQYLNYHNNPYVRGSIFLQGLFNLTNNKRLSNNIIVGNYNGMKGEDRDGNVVGYSTTNLNVRQKAIFDINSLLSRGAIEIMRTESSKSAYFIKLESYRFDKTDPTRKYLPVGISEFTSSFNSPRFKQILIDNYLYDELYRIKTADTVEIYKKDPALMAEAKGFNLFRDILPWFKSMEKGDEQLKNDLKADIEKLTIPDLILKHRNRIEQAIENYFNKELNSFKETLKEENITDSDIGKNLPGKNFDQRIRTFLANDFILNVEYTKLYNGDTIYQSHYKDYFKRSKGDISTGKTPLTDDLFGRFMRQNGNTFSAFIGTLVDNNYKTTRTVNFVDDERTSKYLEIYRRDLKAVNPSLSTKDLDKFLDKYNKLNIGDGQGWITLDFYRQFLKSINNWSDAQELMYKVELAKWRLAHADFNSEYTNEMKENDREFLQQNPGLYSYFPPLKIQYNGPIKAKGTGAMVMDKFSVAPLIPSMIQNTPLENVHNEMLKHGVGYAKFLSGTKKYKAPAYSLYNEDGFTGVDLSKADLSTHFLDYLKEQINTNPKVKEESIFGSQVRKLIEANIFSNGEASESDLERHERYKSYIKGIIELGKEDLYKELSLKEEGGKLFIDNMEKFISTIQNQANLRDLNDNIKDYIQYDKDTKKMMFPLEASLNRRAIQDLIMGIIDRKLRLQKLSGDQLIQISSSGFQSNDFKYRNASEDEVKKYGTNGLRFYHLEYDKDGKPSRTVAAQVKVALNQNGFDKLLLKKHPDGKRIGTIERLNELLKNEDWVKENRKSITLVGYRIPTQGHNSIEYLEVAEFLPPHAGSVVIVPAEIVAKAGSDFDIDKLSIFRPSFDDNGELINDKSKEGYSNKIIDLFSEILSDPKTFEKLIRPNDTDLIKGEVNDIAVDIGKRYARDIADPKPYRGTQIYRYKSNLRKFETLLSAKKLLAIFAVNNTFTTLLQQAGITMSNVYQLPNSSVIRPVRLMLLSPLERQKVMQNDRINLGDKYSVDGTVKQDFLNQLINATVDAASDDFFGYVNASFENVNVLCHLINQGVPFDRAMRFLNQPVLLRYYSDLRKKGVFESKADIQARIFGQLTNTNFFYENDEGKIRLDKKEYNNAINKLLKSTDAEKIYLSKEVLKKTTIRNNQVDEFLSIDRNKSYNALVFAYFISLQEQAQIFRNYQKLLSFDTVKVNSPLAVWQAFRAIENLKVTKMFDENEFKKMLDKSVIAPFENRKLIATIGLQLMPIAFHPWFAREIVPIIDAQTQFKNRTAQKKIISSFENQWIEYAVKSTSKIGEEPLHRYAKYLTEGKNNVARRFNSLISKYPELKTDYSFVNRIRPNFPNKADVKKSNIEIYRLFENTTDDQNRYIAEFRDLINLNNPRKYTPAETQEIRKFFTDLAILGFVQSGFSKSNISFQELIPYEQLADIFKTGIKTIMKYMYADQSLMKAYVQEFIKQFNNNNGDRNTQKWRGRDYYLEEKISIEIAKKSGKMNIIKGQIQVEPAPAPYENTIKYVPGKDTTKTVNIPFQPDNIEKILAGKKTTTTRNEAAANKIGLEPGEIGKAIIGNQEFNVQYRGMLNIEEAGGKQAMFNSEGVTSINEFKFQQTKDWINGKGKLAVYDLSPRATNPIVEQEQLLEPEVKTERQYWPGDKREKGNEVEQALGKAEFKMIIDHLNEGVNRGTDTNFYFSNLPENFTKDQFDKLLEDADTQYDQRLTPENFEKAYNLYKKFGNDIFLDDSGNEAQFDRVEKGLKEIELAEDPYTTYNSISKMFKEYINGNIPENELDQVEKILSDYGLMRYKDLDNFNPAQLKLPFEASDEEYNKQINQVLKDKDKPC